MITSCVEPLLGLMPIPNNPLTEKQARTLVDLMLRIGRPRFWLLKEACCVDVDTPIPYLSKSQASKLIKAIIEGQMMATNLDREDEISDQLPQEISVSPYLARVTGLTSRAMDAGTRRLGGQND